MWYHLTMPKIYKRKCSQCGVYYEGSGKKYCSLSCSYKSKIGYTHTEETKQLQSKVKLGNKNPNWKGNNVGYNALHRFVERRLRKPKFCQNCKKVPPYDLANKGIYNRELKNWWWLCRHCHMKIDGRLKNLKQYKNL